MVPPPFQIAELIIDDPYNKRLFLSTAWWWSASIFGSHSITFGFYWIISNAFWWILSGLRSSP